MKTNRRNGAAMIEFALSFMVVFTLFAGTFQWGYTFYVYDTLVTQVREAARYASTQPLDPSNAAAADRVKRAVQNMVVYGTAEPPAGIAPTVRGLSTQNVTVEIEGTTNRCVTVAIKDYTVDSVFGKMNLNGRPKATYPYTAQPTL